MLFQKKKKKNLFLKEKCRLCVPRKKAIFTTKQIFYSFTEKNLGLLTKMKDQPTTLEQMFYYEVFLFFHTLYFFPYSSNLCFSYSGRFLYRSRPYCRFFFVFFQKDFDIFHEPLFFFCNLCFFSIFFLCFFTILYMRKILCKKLNNF